MKRYIRFSLTISVILFLGNLSALDTNAQIMRQILKRMQENSKSLVSLKGSLKVARFDSTLRETDLYQGELAYVPGNIPRGTYLRIDWSKPRYEQFALANGEYAIYTPRLNRVLVGTIERARRWSSTSIPEALAFLGSTPGGQILKNFDISYNGEETLSSGVRTWHLLMTPRARTSYKGLDIWVDLHGMPLQTRIIETNNDSSTFLIQNVQRNAAINPNIFRITPPKG